MSEPEPRHFSEELQSILLLEIVGDLERVRQGVQQLREEVDCLKSHMATLPLENWGEVLSRQVHALESIDTAAIAACWNHGHAGTAGRLHGDSLGPRTPWRGRAHRWWFPAATLAVAFALGLLTSNVLSLWR